MASLSEAIDLGRRPPTLRDAALHWSATLLVVASWVSAGIFGLYIITFFGGTALAGAAERWNESLPALHNASAPFATFAIGSHFITGGVLLLLGPIQLIGGIRRAVPGLHRWLGRIYVVCAGLAGLGGLGFILSNGTIGGPVMSLGFGLYGALMALGAVLTYAHAHAGRYEQHRAWAIRLFALTVGSWLYRMEYGLWFLLTNKLGHNSDFTGWFDGVMVFFFYLPNLLVAEMFIRARRDARGPVFTNTATGVLAAATAFTLLATWNFTLRYWGPGMVSGVTGAPLD